jgi:cyclohexyl-isocyanide hydratase
VTALLPIFRATVTPARVVVDRNRITVGGVTADIEFGLTLAALIQGEATA